MQIRSIPGFVCIGGLAACTFAALDADPDNPAYGKSLFLEACSVCHGSSGRGDGPGAEGMRPPPANLRLIAARNGGVFDKDIVMSAIFASPSGEEAAMPAFSHANLGPIIIVEKDGLGTPVPTDLLAIANYLETIQDL